MRLSALWLLTFAPTAVWAHDDDGVCTLQTSSSRGRAEEGADYRVEARAHDQAAIQSDELALLASATHGRCNDAFGLTCAQKTDCDHDTECKRLCGYCGAWEPECKDDLKTPCALWVQQGLCQTDFTAKINCIKSCGLCGFFQAASREWIGHSRLSA